MKRLLSLVIACGLLPAASLAAESLVARPLALDVDACIKSRAGDVRRLLSLELGKPILDPSEAGSDALWARVQCEGPALRLSIARRDGSLVSTRLMDVSTATLDAQPRLVAVALAELLLAGEPVVVPRLAPLPAAQVEQGAATPRTPVGPRTFTVSGGGLAYWTAPARRLQWLVEVGLGGKLGGPWALWGNVTFQSTRAQVELGLVTAWAVSGAAFVGVEGALGAVELSAGVGGRAGVTTLRGWPNASGIDAGLAVRPVGGPALALGLAVSLSPRWLLRATAEGGYAFGGAIGTVEGVPAIGVASPWLAGSAGVGLRF